MIKYSQIKKIHFVGIGGSGMSGIAEVLHNMGFVVSGSDLSDGETVKRLKLMGVKVFLGHAAKNVEGVETLVYSSAVNKENLEVKRALEEKIPVIPRAEMLAELMRLKFSIAVAGTHGKTSTTSMIASMLTRAGKDPTYVVGGKLKIHESGAKLGKSDLLVAEADESDGSFLRLFPTLAVITNIEDDHLDYYKTMDKLNRSFADFGNKVPFYGSVFLNYQCENTRNLLPHIHKKVTTYSLDFDTDIKADDVETTAFESHFNLIVHGRDLGRMKLSVGGLHNVSNALAAIAVCLEIGMDVETIKGGLANFTLPARRFQVLFSDGDVMVIDDYAHHPTEIQVTLDTLKRGDFKRIIAVFQPHRYTRLEILMDRFATCFNQADKVIVSELYTANQRAIDGVSSRKLYEKIKETSDVDIHYIENFEHIADYLEKDLQKGDAIVFLAAGNLTHTAHQFARNLLEKRK